MNRAPLRANLKSNSRAGPHAVAPTSTVKSTLFDAADQPFLHIRSRDPLHHHHEVQYRVCRAFPAFHNLTNRMAAIFRSFSHIQEYTQVSPVYIQIPMPNTEPAPDLRQNNMRMSAPIDCLVRDTDAEI